MVIYMAIGSGKSEQGFLRKGMGAGYLSCFFF